MLRELSIDNLAMFEGAGAELEAGFTAFTGQTGAGKSLLLRALRLVCGARANGSVVRHGCDQATVHALLEVGGDVRAARVGAVLGQDLTAGDELVVSRSIRESGRSSVRVNGQPVTLVMLREAMAHLIDIHGQHDTQLLRRASQQLAAVDAAAGIGAEDADRLAWQEAWREATACRKRLVELRASGQQRSERLELLRFQVQEIDAVAPVAGEFQKLVERERVLGGVADLQATSGRALTLLDAEDGSGSARDLREAGQLLAELARTDGRLEALGRQLREAALVAQEAAFDLRRYAEGLESDPAALHDVQARLAALGRSGATTWRSGCDRPRSDGSGAGSARPDGGRAGAAGWRRWWHR